MEMVILGRRTLSIEEKKSVGISYPNKLCNVNLRGSCRTDLIDRIETVTSRR